MNQKLSEQALQNEIAKLPQDIEPRRDLWNGIERAIAETSQHDNHKKSHLTPVAWAASLVAAVLVTWLSFSPLPAVNSTNYTQVLNDSFEQQKQLLLASFGQPKLTNLPIEMQKQLKELSAARTTIEKALADDPNNNQLLNLLRWTQKQEIDLLKQLYSPQWQTI